MCRFALLPGTAHPTYSTSSAFFLFFSLVLSPSLWMGVGVGGGGKELVTLFLLSVSYNDHLVEPAVRGMGTKISSLKSSSALWLLWAAK